MSKYIYVRRKNKIFICDYKMGCVLHYINIRNILFKSPYSILH